MIKRRKESGSAIIVCMVIMFFLGAIGILNFTSSKTDLMVSSNITSENIKFQAAEESIKITMKELFSNETSIERVLQMTSDDSYVYCSDKGSSSDQNCDFKYMNQNGTIKAKATTKLTTGIECLAYGNSDKKTYCFTIRAVGDIPILDGDEEVHIQEVQINTVNINNNGVYEL